MTQTYDIALGLSTVSRGVWRQLYARRMESYHLKLKFSSAGLVLPRSSGGWKCAVGLYYTGFCQERPSA
jgi:hypothetical protein